MNWMQNFISIWIPAALPRMPNAKTITQLWKMDLNKSGGGRRVFCNPPYGKEIGKWVEKCYQEAHSGAELVVMLIPARTDTKYFHDYIYKKAKEIRFLKGRLKFEIDGEPGGSAPFPSCLLYTSDAADEL